MVIRRATIDDLKAIQTLYCDSSFNNYKDIAKHEEIDALRQQYFNTERLTNELTNPSDYSTWYVVEDGGLLGIILFGFNSETQTEIYSLFVDTKNQGRGIGSALTNHVIAISKDNGATEIVVETIESTKAESFYKKLGFQAVGKGPSGHFPSSGLAELAMRRPIG